MTYECCKDCTKRHEGCHSACPDYVAEKICNGWEHDRILKRKNEVADYNSFRYDCIAKSTGRRAKRV